MANINTLHGNWIIHGEHETSSNGNLGPLSMNIFLNWIMRSWHGIPDASIIQTFKSCGVTSAVDGSEDAQILLFKQNKSSDGVALLQQKRQSANQELLTSFFEAFETIQPTAN
jgi:hypothetical protein